MPPQRRPVLPVAAPPSAGQAARRRARQLTGRTAAAAERWRRGAEGEEATAAILAPLETIGWRILHDRAVPDSAANIDHLVITPTVVWVIDTKHYQGTIRRLGDGQLWYGRTRLADHLRSLHWITGRVRQLLARELATTSATVMTGLCIHGTQLPSPHLIADGTLLTTTRALLTALLATEPDTPPPDGLHTIHTLHQACRRRFPPR